MLIVDIEELAVRAGDPVLDIISELDNPPETPTDGELEVEAYPLCEVIE